jgi:hypothetical protein
MKVKLNPMFEEARGDLGDLVFREVRGKTVVSRKADMSILVPSEGQLAHREKFRQAAAYGRSALGNETLREFYAEAAERQDKPIFALTVADFMNPPVIGQVDLSPYNGQTGDLILLTATDDFGVENVYVMITNGQGNAVESGEAVQNPASPNHWTYMATASLPAGDTANIRIVATDRPRNSAVVRESKVIQP